MHDPIRKHMRPSYTALAILLSMMVNTGLPVMAGLVPTQALADETHTPAASPQTAPYTLSAGENLPSVARKFHTTPDALKKMNFLRSFSHGIESISAGDELDVPGTAAAAPPADNDGADLQMADIATQTGSFLSASPNSAAVSSLARDRAAGKVGDGLQSWLSQFGTAQVYLDADKKLSLKNSQFDLLLPLWDSDHALVFTQGSLHRTDDRNQGNLGTGVRWFTDEWLAGLNAFYDDDMSLGHKRIGFGLEYWRDDLKLAANDYQRVSGWRDATDKQGYEARPASGWDLRAEGWLPSLPELGGSLTWEQYYGDHVSLFGKDNLQKNPWATTAGLSYTPIPLVSLYARERAGQSGRSDASLGVNLTYHPGIALATQLSADAVAASRRVAGSHGDLVSRNNNIVLDYREKQRLLLTSPSALQGVSSGLVQMNMSVTGNHTPVSVSLRSPTLLSHGGSITQTGDLQYTLRLPAWAQGPAQQNTYTLTSEAHDQDGNSSGLAVSTLVVTPLPVMNLTSSVSSEKSTASSDADALWGTNDYATLTLIANDAAGNPMAGLAVTSKMTGSGATGFSAGSWTDNHDGTYISTVRVQSTPGGDVDIMPQVGGVDAVSHPVKIKYSPQAQGQLTLTPAEINADGQSSASLIMQGPNNDFTPNNVDVEGEVKNNVRVSTWKPLGGSNWGATVTGTKQGTVTLMATDSGSPLARKPVTLTLTANIDAQKSTLSADRQELTSDGVDAATLTFSPKSLQGEAVTGLLPERITLSGADLSALHLTPWREVSAGEYQSHATLSAPGSVEFGIRVDGKSAASQNITLTGSQELAKITGVASMVGEKMYFTFDPRDGFPQTAPVGSGAPRFQVLINAGSMNKEYLWSVNQDWLTIDDTGLLRITGTPTQASKKTTVTATPKDQSGHVLTYTFTIRHVYPLEGTTEKKWGEAKEYCERIGQRIPGNNDLTTATAISEKSQKAVGKLFGEWPADMLTGWSFGFWSNDSYAKGQHFYVDLASKLGAKADTSPSYTACEYDL